MEYGAWRSAVLEGSNLDLVKETLESGGLLRLSGLPAAVWAAADGVNRALPKDRRRRLAKIDLEGWEPTEGDLLGFAYYRAALADREPDAATLALAEGRGPFRAA
ncbi:MAG: hypothetical protein AAF725_04235, partial [Acidobacteriota bacterium]